MKMSDHLEIYREISQLAFNIETFAYWGQNCLYKTRNNISSHIMEELFEQRNTIYLKSISETDFTTGPISTEEFKISRT